MSNQFKKDITLTIIGDGPERSNLEKLASELNVESQIRFAGVLLGDELARTLNQHRYLWVPSRWEEPFGNVALEGMACGCIPIVSNGGGLPDAVGKAGLTFERGSVDDLVRVSNRLMADARAQNLLRDLAVEHLGNHQPSVIGRRYLDVIENAHAN